MNVTLQINLAPNDYLHARYLLKHQLDVFKDQVDEILLIIDTKASKGRFAEGWNENSQALKDLLTFEIIPNYKVKIEYVDYHASIKKEVANYFFESNDIPEKDFRGGPFYAYFFGLFKAQGNYVLHLDSDMFLGGQSKTWIKEAITYFKKFENCLFLSPLPGPPHPDEKLIDQTVINKIGSYAFELKGMSTRIFLIDKSKFKVHKLSLQKPSIKNQLKALIEKNPNAQLPEQLFEIFMRKHNYTRIDFLGSENGMWSLHPPFRNEIFYQKLSELLAMVKQTNFPPSQFGYYDIVDEVCDWSSAKEKIRNNRWWKRINLR